MEPLLSTGRVATPAEATPYCGPPIAPSEALAAWNLAPPLLAALAVFLALGLWRATEPRAVLLGWTALIVAFVSPLCAMTTALFLARSAHHLVVLAVAAPALAAGWPLRRPAPVVAFLATALALILWHLPAAYSRAWDSALVYWTLQLLLLSGAWALWSVILTRAEDAPARLVTGVTLALGLGSVMSLLGALLTFAPRPLYIEHLTTSAAWGMSPLADQQAAGLVMWVPGMLLMSAGLALAARRAWRRVETA